LLIINQKKYENTSHYSFGGRFALRAVRERRGRNTGGHGRSGQRIQSSVSLSGRAANWLRQRFKANSFRLGEAARRARGMVKSRGHENRRCLET
jgi:hypothetical protein